MVSPYEEDAGAHVICIYTENFCDQEQVLQLEHMLRRAGIFCFLLFKPDIFTHLGIYKGTYPNIQPTLYKSTYDTEKRKGIVTTESKYEEYFRLSWSRDI